MNSTQSALRSNDLFGGDVGDNAERDAYDFDDDEPCCYRCDGTGEILVCPDDICRGMGECMHGDGEIICPVCRGDG